MRSEEEIRVDPSWQTEDGLDIRRHLRTLRQGAWLIGASLLLALAGGIAYLAVTPKTFRASSSVLVESNAPRVLGEQTDAVSFDKRTANDPSPSKEFMETQYRVISSRDVLGRVVRELNLDRDLDFLGLAKIRDPDELAQKRRELSPVKVLQEKVIVAPVRDSQLIEVLVDDTVPERASAIANSVVAAYLQSNLDRRLESTKAARIWLADQMDALKGKLETSELELFTFQQENDLLANEDGTRQDLVSLRLNSLTESLALATARRIELSAAVSEIELTRQEKGSDSFWPLNLRRVAEDRALIDLRQSYMAAESESINASERYLDKHPVKLAVDARLRRIGAQINTTMGNVLHGLKSEYRAALSVERQLEWLIDDAKAEAFELRKKEIDRRKLQREQENNERLYDLVLARLKDADLAMLLQTNNVHVLDRAETPMLPVYPRAATVLTLAMILGAGVGVGLAYGKSLLRHGAEEAVVRKPE